MEIVDIVKASAERAPWGWALLATCITGLIKAWPILAKLSIDANAVLRREKRDDLMDCKTRLDLMAARLDTAEARTHDFEMKLLSTISAYRILDAEVAARFPESSALTQARIVLSSAFAVSPSTPEDMLAKAKEAI